MIDVVGAIIINEKSEILIARRNKEKKLGGLWELPGGKVEKNEKPQAGLIREIQEEMSIDIKIENHFANNIHKNENGEINLITYIARIINGEIKLTDHDKIEWVRINDIDKYNFSPADIPIINHMKNRLHIEVNKIKKVNIF